MHSMGLLVFCEAGLHLLFSTNITPGILHDYQILQGVTVSDVLFCGVQDQ